MPSSLPDPTLVLPSSEVLFGVSRRTMLTNPTYMGGTKGNIPSPLFPPISLLSGSIRYMSTDNFERNNIVRYVLHTSGPHKVADGPFVLSAEGESARHDGSPPSPFVHPLKS